jgi:hypothetical protein
LAWQKGPALLDEKLIRRVEDRFHLREVKAQVSEHVRILGRFSREQERQLAIPPQRLLEEVEPPYIFDLSAGGIFETFPPLPQLLAKIFQGGRHEGQAEGSLTQVSVEGIRKVLKRHVLGRANVPF